MVLSRMEPSPSLAIIFTAFVVAIAQSDFDSECPRGLPKNVIPSAYKILLSPNYVNFTFTGVSEIEITVKENNTKKIMLHGAVTIESVAVIKEDVRISAEWTKNKTTRIQTLILDEAIDAGNYVLILEYIGSLQKAMAAFYRSSYINDEGNEVWFAATEFYKEYARFVFPCWDEPGFMATFIISIKHPDNYIASSNTAVLSRERDETDDTQIITKFEKTPEIPTYLVSFIVSDFESLSNGIFTIWGRKSFIENGKLGFHFPKLISKTLEDITGVTYEQIRIRKINIVAIPNFKDKRFFARKRGIILIDESNVVVEEKAITTDQHKPYLIDMTEPLTGLWLSQLPTPLCWNHVWLNYAISYWFHPVVLDKIIPKQEPSKLLEGVEYYRDINGFFKYYSSRVDTLAVGSRDKLDFSKGRDIIRMIRHILGEKSFLVALRNYFNKTKATPTDFFNEVAAESTYITPNLTSVLNHWTDTPGYPVITVTRNYAAGTANLTQERFLAPPNATHDEFYVIPINYATQRKRDFDNTTITSWLINGNETTVLDGGFAENEWVIFNKLQSGYYRVNYDNENWRLITEALKGKNFSDIPILNRLRLVDDAFDLADNGKLDYGTALNFIGYLEHEDDNLIWTSMGGRILQINKKLQVTGQSDNFKTYILRLLDNYFRSNFSEYASDESGKYGPVMPSIIYCRMESKPCRDYASKKLINWLNDDKVDGYPPGLKGVILCTGMLSADSITWNQAFEAFLNNPRPIYLTVLVCTKNEKLTEDLFMKILMGSRSDWIARLLLQAFQAYRNYDELSNSADLMLDLIIQNKQMILKIMKQSDIGPVINYMSNAITTRVQLDKLKKIIADNVHLKNINADFYIHRVEDEFRWTSAHELEFVKFFENEEEASSANGLITPGPLAE